MLIDQGVAGKAPDELDRRLQALPPNSPLFNAVRLSWSSMALVHMKQGMEVLTGFSPTGMPGKAMPKGPSRSPLLPP
jgi:hypothetical protein